MNSMKKTEAVIGYAVSVHLLFLCFMFAFRVLLLFVNFRYLDPANGEMALAAHAFVIGLWFDNVVACYITFVPLAVLLLFSLFNRAGKALFGVCNAYYVVFYSLSFGISIGNIPYFAYFYKPLNSSIFNWGEEANTNMLMVLEESRYWAYLLLFILSVAYFTFLVHRISRKFLSKAQKPITGKEYALYVPASLFLLALCVFGCRGRVGYNPIRTSEAYFTDNSFINQLGINPVFYFMRDIYDVSKSFYNPEKLIAESKATRYVHNQLIDSVLPPPSQAPLSKHISAGEKAVLNSGESPVARVIEAEGEERRMNVVVVLMESMSADLLTLKSGGKELTPCLNKLIRESYYFRNFYSSGIHTNCGILATLYGMPSLLDRNMMKGANVLQCRGLPNLLKERGYQTMFFVSHEAQYDNIKAFVTENGIQDVYSQESYPASKRVNVWGVADDYLFEYAVNKLNEKAKSGTPFFATILTTSNHPPYVVPERFKQAGDDPQMQILAFVDDAVGQFMDRVSGQEWYRNTLFVFLGDHGKLVGEQRFDMPLSYNHIPLIIHSPVLKDAPRSFDRLGGQVDVFPTIAGLLRETYVNNTLGIDLFKDKRPYIFFSSDDAIGCIDTTFFYNLNMETNREAIYRYKDPSSQNLIREFRSKADSMRAYSASMLETANYMYKKRNKNKHGDTETRRD